MVVPYFASSTEPMPRLTPFLHSYVEGMNDVGTKNCHLAQLASAEFHLYAARTPRLSESNQDTGNILILSTKIISEVPLFRVRENKLQTKPLYKLFQT